MLNAGPTTANDLLPLKQQHHLIHLHVVIRDSHQDAPLSSWVFNVFLSTMANEIVNASSNSSKFAFY